MTNALTISCAVISVIFKHLPGNGTCPTSKAVPGSKRRTNCMPNDSSKKLVLLRTPSHEPQESCFRAQGCCPAAAIPQNHQNLEQSPRDLRFLLCRAFPSNAHAHDDISATHISSGPRPLCSRRPFLLAHPPAQSSGTEPRDQRNGQQEGVNRGATSLSSRGGTRIVLSSRFSSSLGPRGWVGGDC